MRNRNLAILLPLAFVCGAVIVNSAADWYNDVDYFINEINVNVENFLPDIENTIDARLLLGGPVKGHAKKHARNQTPQAVAHCIAGQVRTLASPMIYQNYKAHVIDKIGADSDIFFSIDVETDATDIWNPTNIAIQSPRLKWQYDRWLACMKMIRHEEIEQHKIYSHIIVSRPDQVVLQDMPHVKDFPMDTVWVKKYGEFVETFGDKEYSRGDDNAEPVLPGGTDGLSDLFLVVPRYVAGVFFPLMSNMNDVNSVCSPKETKRTICGDSYKGKECTIKCALNRLDVPAVEQEFQVRIVRDHNPFNGIGMKNRSCPRRFGDLGKFYNSICQ